MPRYIDADKARSIENLDNYGTFALGIGTISDVQEVLDDAPTADVAPVVRCKDCAYGRYDDESEMYECGYVGLVIYNEPNHYCSYGERKEK